MFSVWIISDSCGPTVTHCPSFTWGLYSKEFAFPRVCIPKISFKVSCKAQDLACLPLDCLLEVGPPSKKGPTICIMHFWKQAYPQDQVHTPHPAASQLCFSLPDSQMNFQLQFWGTGPLENWDNTGTDLWSHSQHLNICLHPQVGGGVLVSSVAV